MRERQNRSRIDVPQQGRKIVRKCDPGKLTRHLGGVPFVDEAVADADRAASAVTATAKRMRFIFISP